MIRCVITAVATLLFALPTSAGVIRIELEDYTTLNDVLGDTIRTVPLSGCSSGYVLVGLDFEDEWTQYELSVSEFGTFTLAMGCRGEGIGALYTFRAELTGSVSGATQHVDVNFTGAGYG